MEHLRIGSFDATCEDLSSDPMDHTEYNSNTQHFINNLKMRLGSKFDAMFQEFTDAKTLEDKMKVAMKFKSYFGPSNYIDRLYKSVEDKTNFKSSTKAKIFRNEGLEAYQKRNYKEALMLYTNSIAYAPLDSYELASVYARRSEVLHSMGKYRECLEDIEGALSHGYPLKKRYKLLLRELVCHRDLGNIMKANISYMKAINVLNSMPGLIEEWKEYMKMQLDLELHYPSQVFSSEGVIFPTEVPELSYGPNPEVVGASSAVRIEYNEQQGRHLVATRDINIGDVLLIAENLVVTVKDEHKYDHCTHCHKLCHHLRPCSNCVWMLFCSEKCRTEANQKYHNVECAAYSRFRFITGNSSSAVKDVSCRVIRLFAMIGIENLQPYFKYSRMNIDNPDHTRGFHSNGIFDSFNLDTIFEIFSSQSLAVETDYLMASSTALQVPQCFGLSTEHPDFFAIAGLFVYLELIALANCPSASYTDFRKMPMKFIHPTLCFNPLQSLLNHSCILYNVYPVHYRNKLVYLAKWPITKGSVLSVSYVALDYLWSKEQRQKYLKDHCGFDCKCIVCEENWSFTDQLKCISDPTDEEVASKLLQYNENRLIEIHACYNLREFLAAQLKGIVKERRDLLTKLWNKREFLDAKCTEMQEQLDIYQFLQGNRFMSSTANSSEFKLDPSSAQALVADIELRHPAKNMDFTE